MEIGIQVYQHQMLKILLVVCHHDFLAQRYYTLFVKMKHPGSCVPSEQVLEMELNTYFKCRQRKITHDCNWVVVDGPCHL